MDDTVITVIRSRCKKAQTTERTAVEQKQIKVDCCARGFIASYNRRAVLMHRWSDDITNELKLKLKHRLSNRLWAGSKQNPKIRENRSSKTTAEERATGRDQWQQPYTPMFHLSFSGVSLGIAQKTMSLHMIKNHIKTIWTHFPSQSRRNVTQFFPQRDSKTKVENRRKQNLFRKLKTFLAFLLKKVQQQSLAD